MSANPAASALAKQDAHLEAFAAKTRAAGLENTVVIRAPFASPSKVVVPSTWAMMPVSDLSSVLDEVIVHGHRGAGKQARAMNLKPHKNTAHGLRKPAHDVHLLGPIEFYLVDGGTSHLSKPRKASKEGILEAIFSAFPRTEARTSTARDILKVRAIAAIIALVEETSEECALQALAAPDDLSALVAYLASSEVGGAMARSSSDPLAAALLRGVLRRKEMLAAEGGTASGQEIADALGISRQAVDKRRRAGDLLGVPVGSGDWRYPWWQLSDGRVLPGFEDVMAALEPLSPWTQLDFFLSADERLNGERPVDLLHRGELERVIPSAKAIGEQGAR